jgi:hypothetical protein
MKSPSSLGGQETSALFEQLIAASPSFAAGHALMALTLAHDAPPASEVPARLRRAHREAERAIALHPPSAGAAYDALYFLARIEAPRDLSLAETQVEEGLRAAPTFPFLSMRRCAFLMEVGRIQDGRPFCDRAVALRPLAPPPAHVRAAALFAAGQTAEGLKAIDQSVRLHPDHAYTKRVRFEMRAFSGLSAEAAAILADETQRPPRFSPEAVSILQAYLRIAGTHPGPEVDKVLARADAAARSGQLERRYPIMMAARLGRTDLAFSWLSQIDPGKLVGSALLFDPALEPLRRDPRFMGIAAKSGHIVYWRKAGIWPDFCADPTLPYDCKAEAAKALAP